MSGLTPRLAHWSARHPVLILCAAALVLFGAVSVLVQMRFEQSLSAMFGTTGDASAAMRRIATEYNTTDELLVLVTTPSATGATDRLVDFAERLESSLLEVAPDMVSSIRWTKHGIERAYIEDVMAPAAPYYLGDEGFETFLERLTPDGMRAQLRRSEQLMRTPGPGVGDLVSAMVRDPLRISELVDRSGTTMGEDVDSALERSSDGRTLLIRISGTRKVDDLEFSKRFTALVERLATEVADDEEIELAGGYAIASVTGRGIRGDAIRSVLIAVTLLHLIFFIAFRRITAPVAIAAVTGSGLVVGFSLVGLQGMTLTPLAATVAAILAGLGIDYGIHFLSHYDAGRGRGLDPMEASEETLSSIAFPLGACFLTTSCGFISLLVSNVMMLRQFAALAAAGLAGCVLAVIVLMPAVMRLLGARSRFTEIKGGLPLTLIRHPRASLSIGMTGAMVVIGCVIWKGGVPGLESDLSVMHPRPNRPLEVTNSLGARFGGAGETVPVEVRAESDEALRERVEAARLALSNVEGVRGVIGLPQLVPAPEVSARAPRLSTIDAETIITRFREAVSESAFREDAFGDYDELLGRMVDSTPPDLETLRSHPDLAGRVLAKSYPGTLLAVQLEESLDRRDTRDEIVTRIREALDPVPDAVLGGLSAVAFDLEKATRGDLPRVASIASLLIVVCLAITVRHPYRILLACVPPAFAMASVIATMALTDLRLNAINGVAIPLLLGITVDAGVFLVTGRTRPEDLAPTVRAVLVSSATTFAGFGTLCLSSTPAIVSLGMLACAGVTGSLLGALGIVVPALVLRQRQ